MAGFDALFGEGKEGDDLSRKVYWVTVISGGSFFSSFFVILKFL